MLVELCLNPIFSMFDLCPKIYPSPYSQTEYSVCRPLINFYPIRLNISVSNPISKSTSAAIFKYHDSLLRLKIQSRLNLRTIYFPITCRELISERNQIRLSAELIAQSSVRRNLFRSVLCTDEFRGSIFIRKNNLAQPVCAFGPAQTSPIGPI